MNTQDNDNLTFDDNIESVKNKKCPACGFELYQAAKYCSECGFGFEKKSVKADNTRGSLKAMHKFELISPALFVLFALLLFAFYAAPVIGFNGLGFSVYALCGNVGDTTVRVLMILLVVLAVVTLIIAFVNAYIQISRVIHSAVKRPL